jgi:tetratricopeptide (TPR) repeat protein
LNKVYIYIIAFSLICIAAISCVTKKKKNETTAFGKFYHNTTAYYNGYWNAKEILKESMVTLRLANTDDYNKILEVEDYVSINDPKMVKSDMDKIIEKVTTVAQLHEPSEWVDDCYVMIGKAQYLKQEYETAEETFEYFQEDFNPSNPYGRNYKSKKPTGKAAKKAKEAEKKEREEAREKVKIVQVQEREAKAKTKAEERKEKEKEKAKTKKEREKARKEDAKNRKNNAKSKTQSETKPDIKNEKTIEPSSSPTENKSKVAQESKKQETVEPEYVPEKPKTPEKDKTAYSEGMLWLAKVYIKRENWFSAEILLEKLESGAVSDDIKSDLPATFASLYIKQQRYDEALVKLEQAIDLADDKQQKARYSFIGGQVTQLQNRSTKALKYFADAKKYSKDIKMEFMAELAVAKNGINSGTRSKESVINDLKKMLGEEKNAKLKDQIYFTLAEIEFSLKNTNEAVDYFKNSVAYNVSDQKLKSEAYYRIANIYYEKEKYLEASNYFDSTYTLLQKADARFALVQKYVSNLKEIATNIEIIRYQDTLLFFASLSEADQKKVIPKWLDKNKKQAENNQSGALFTKQLSAPGVTDFGTSSFFAYNRNTKTKGKEDFDKIWGRRPLEDDWRRISKSSGGLGESKDQTNVGEADGKEEKISKEEYEKFLRELPSNPIKKQEANDKIMVAMFTLGKLFRDKIENFIKSAETLESMHTRFGPTPYEMDSYFYLYLDYTDLANAAKAQEYKDKLKKKYPDSRYTAILSDPDYFTKSGSKVGKAEQYYRSVYELFEKGEYIKTLDAIDQAPNIIGDDNRYAAKMALLRAMCLGSKEGKDAYVKALNEVITSYPNTPEQTKAKEIMRFLGGDKSAFANVQDVDKIYQREENTTHFVVVVTYALEENRHVNFKVAISEYNKKNFKLERLQLGDASLNITDNSQIILIRKFENETKAMEYYRKVIKDTDEFTGKEQYTYDVFAISQPNYRKMLSEKTAASYRVFFENNIIGVKDR